MVIARMDDSVEKYFLTLSTEWLGVAMRGSGMKKMLRSPLNHPYISILISGEL